LIVGLFIFLAVAWIMVLTRLVLDFAGIWRLPSKAQRWIGSGSLLSVGVMVVNAYADARNWPYPRTPLHAFGGPIILTGVALLVIGVVIQSREPRRPRRAKHSRE
jgi:hypothetical protein